MLYYFFRGVLYVRLVNNQITELVFPKYLWSNADDSECEYFSIIQVRFGSEPSFRSKVFYGNPEGYKDPSSENFIKFEKATDKQILELLNSWNDSLIVAGSVRNWLNTVREKCEIMVEPEKERLIKLAQQSKYW
jgi:hypothetical protein